MLLTIFIILICNVDYERYEYAISLLNKPFDFTVDEDYTASIAKKPSWPDNLKLSSMNLWRQKVKYDALNLTLAGKEWDKIKEVLEKRYRYAIKTFKAK